MHFLDVNVYRENGTFFSNICIHIGVWKPSLVFTLNFAASLDYKFILFHTLLHRFEIGQLKKILLVNGWMDILTNLLTNTFLNSKIVVCKKIYDASIYKKITFHCFTINWRNMDKNCFKFKEIVPESLKSCQIYKFECKSTNAAHIGKIFNHVEVSDLEHQWVSLQASKLLKGTLSSSVREHIVSKVLFAQRIVSALV